MAQQIRYLYNELRQPKHTLSTQELAQIVTRTFDALDALPTTINSTTNITQIVAGLWTQVGTNLYPTVIATTNVILGMTSWDGTLFGGALVARGPIITATGSTNTSFLAMNTAFTETTISSSLTGTGVFLPMSLYTGGNRRATLDTGGTFIVGFFSHDLGTTVGRILASNLIGVFSGTANSSGIWLSVTAGTETQLNSNISGTGTFLPMTFYTNGVRQVTLTTAGSLFNGFTSSDVFGGNCIVATGVGGIGVMTAATNASVGFMNIGLGLVRVESSNSGTGTLLPLAFFVGDTESMRLTTPTRVLLVGITSTDLTVSTGMIISASNHTIVTATTNASFLSIGITAGTETTISSAHTGTGTDLPLSFYTSGSRRLTIDTSGTIIAGALSAGDFVSAARFITNNDFIACSAFTNASTLRMVVSAGSSSIIQSGTSGTGTQLPLAFLIAATESARITTNGCWLFGITSTDDFTTNGKIINGVAIDIVNATSNANVMNFSISGGVCQIVSTSTGTATQLPLALRSGKVFVNKTTDDGTGAVLQVNGNVSVNGTVLTVP